MVRPPDSYSDALRPMMYFPNLSVVRRLLFLNLMYADKLLGAD